MSRLSHFIAPTHSSHQSDPSSPAWGYLSSWCDELRLQNYSKRTITTYQTALIQFFNFLESDNYLGGDPLACRRQDLTRFFSTRLEEEKSNPSVPSLAYLPFGFFINF